jgi:glycosyltransferase involved in cell wall biosynthesis
LLTDLKFDMVANPTLDCKLFCLPESSPSTKICVVVPVCNEAEHLFNVLEALRLQVDDRNEPLNLSQYEVLVLVNNSDDDSFSIATAYQKNYPEFQLLVTQIVLEKHEANIGKVRRLLMDEACRRLSIRPDPDGIIASIDGDTIADNQWLFFVAEEIALGNDAVGGQILTIGSAGNAQLHHVNDITYRCLLTKAESLLDPLPNDPLPRHFQYFGANMAVTCAMYLKAGGLPQVECLEDMAFHKALMLHDAKIRRSYKVKVYTSARQDGRVSVGFSEQLKKWSVEQEADIPQLVEHVKYSLSLFRLRGKSRLIWKLTKTEHLADEEEYYRLATELKIEDKSLRSQLQSSTYFGEFWDTVSSHITQDQPQLQPIDDAIHQLRDFIEKEGVIAFERDPAYKYVLSD